MKSKTDSDLLKKYFILGFLLIVLAGMIASFASCEKNTEPELKSVTGIIAVVGNEPFTTLAVIAGDKTVYGLDGPDEIIESLWHEQGNTYKIIYSESYEYLGLTYLKIIKVEKKC